MDSLEIDRNLIISLNKGDLKAFDKIVVFYQKIIYNHLYRFINNADDAADLTQETFIKVYKNKDKIDLNKNFKSWLYMIATNTAYDWLKKKKRQPNFEELDEVVEFETNSPQSSYYNIEQLKIMDLENALKAIKPNAENILRLYYEQGFTYQEIAEILNIPINTVKTNLSRAKKELLKKFES
ncbi:MAG: RNA polymerase sigma factor [Candidatus Falkowbacteria bacterium]|nr:RNA polymerase sigma factor [Candidatus Falkowbacteria bacterium]